MVAAPVAVVGDGARKRVGARAKVEIRAIHRFEVSLPPEETTLGSYRDVMAALKTLPDEARVTRGSDHLVVTN